MSWEAKYIAEGDYVLLINSGTFTMQQAKDETVACFELTKKHDTGKILLDGRKRERIEMSPSEYYQMPELYEKLVPKGIMMYKEALVLPEGKDSDEGMRFYETLCRNRGYLVETFKDFDEAEKWLTSDDQV